MSTTKRNKVGLLEEYLAANRKASREIELERNGGRWIAVDRPHKNKKMYDRKRDRRVDLDGFSFKKKPLIKTEWL